MNPLIDFAGLPDFRAIKPERVDEAIDRALADFARVADETAACPDTPDWDNTFARLQAADEGVSRIWAQVEHLHSVMSTPPWRKAHNANLDKVVAHYAAIGQHQGLYRRLCRLCEGEDFAALSPLRRKIALDAKRDFELSGVGLTPEARKEFRQNSQKLAALSAKFEEHLLDATNDFFLPIKNEATLGEMPADLKNAARAAAAETKEEGFRFTLQAPSYLAFMQYATERDLREKMYRAHCTRASEFGPSGRDNRPLIDEILALRARQAELLGFAHYGELAMQTRMAGSAQKVMDFLRDMARRALPFGRREMARLRDFAADILGIADLQAWDVPFAADALRRRDFDFTDAQLRPYLQQEKILEGMFAVAARLFSLKFEPMTAPLWTREARVFGVKDGAGGRVGYLYLDLFSRDTKRGGAWMGESLCRCRRGGALQLPAAYINCNFARPAPGATALLNWREAETLFHEFGHALHHLLTEVEEFSASGMNGVEWDAVELPSQFLENFLWDWEVLRPMTMHAENGELMPEELFAKVLSARQFHSGLGLLRQLEFSLFDMEIHHRESPSPDAVLARVRGEVSVLPPPPYNRFECGFSHIFAGGYAAGYYSYLWAEMLSADAFSRFAARKKDGGDVLCARLGAAFRRQILAVGGGRPALESFIAFCGREPRIEPLLAHHGLAE